MVTREQLIEQSVQTFVRKALFDDHGYPNSKIEIMESFPSSRFQGPLDKNYLAAGFNFDDPGQKIELGSKLTQRVYTIEWFVWGLSDTWGRNLAHAVKFALEEGDAIPLLDITEPEPWPEIDRLIVLGVNSEDVPIPDPTPAEEHLWRTVVRVEDQYFPEQAWF